MRGWRAVRKVHRSSSSPAGLRGRGPVRTWIAVLLLFLAGRPPEALTMPDPRTNEALALMTAFAARTGLTGEQPARRYLWTDAFAVCNFLGLARTTGDDRQTQLALALVDQVHRVLGRHRPDDRRTGWISGLSAREGEAHPTQGGLRIGKPLPERGIGEPYDEQLEWDRDGQYFHYLTKWMLALDQATRATGDARFNVWARELAQTARHAFTHQPSAGAGAPRLYWKMSIDLTRPLVPAMGQHDPLDGYVTCARLRATAATLPGAVSEPSLDAETRHFAALIEGGRWATADPLGIGGLLGDAYQLGQLVQQGALADDGLLDQLLAAAVTGLQAYVESGEYRLPAEYRLAFRDLGLAIGLQAAERMARSPAAEAGPPPADGARRAQLEAVLRYQPVGDAIVSFWRDPANRNATSWTEHRDINEVMLATALAPDGCLDMRPPRR
jgi:hypothetical protein